MSLCVVCGRCPGQEYTFLQPVVAFPVCSCCSSPVAAANLRRYGRSTSYLPEFSIEFEVRGATSERAMELVLLGYLRTPDGTVDDEYKSPIYTSLDQFRYHLPALESLRDLVDDQCGSHIHIGFPSTLASLVTDHRNAIFGRLLDHIVQNPEATKQFWGRYPCYYAGRSLDTSFPCIRTRSRYNTIEFRLPRFQSALQYLMVVKFCRQVTMYLRRAFTAWTLAQDEACSPEKMGADVLDLYSSARLRYQVSRRRYASVPSRTVASPVLQLSGSR